jgi:broad specificity phosphatase PhoE
MSARIHLVRHGHSAHVHDGRWFWHHNVSEYEDAYDAAGIRDDSLPPPEVIRLAESAIVVASDMTRAIHSAQRLVDDREIVKSPLLRECRLEPARWVPVPLPITVWDIMYYAQWRSRLARNTDHPAVRRAAEASTWLSEHLVNDRDLVAVTHGGFRHLLHAQFLRRGWRLLTARRRHHNWSVWSYEI